MDSLLAIVKGDTKLKNLLVGAWRRVWHRHPLRIKVLMAARVEVAEYRNDGSLRAKPGIFYKCGNCGILGKNGPSKTHLKVYVDHITPVIPLDNIDIDWNTLITRIFMCEEAALQILCSVCHSAKTKIENQLRRDNRKV